ncbi:MAG: tetratricopeptide repeat protein [Planctomycetota bacterium]
MNNLASRTARTESRSARWRSSRPRSRSRVEPVGLDLRALTLLNNLGANLARAGRPDDAARVLREAAEGLEAKVGLAHPHAAAAWSQVASLMLEGKKPGEALVIVDRLIEAAREARAEVRPDVLRSRARALAMLGRTDEAAEEFRASLAAARRAFAERPDRLHDFVRSILEFHEGVEDEAGVTEWRGVLDALGPPVDG